jgi:hypothetical protein
MAGDRSVHGEPAFARLAPSDDEFIGQVRGSAEVHLVGRLAGERRMRHVRVVLLHEEGDQRFEMSHGVERVEIQPLMLEGAQSFDHRVRVGDLDLREHAALLRGSEGGVDCASSLRTVTSMCQYSLGRHARKTRVGLAACTRVRGRSQPCRCTRRAHVVTDTKTLPALRVPPPSLEPHSNLPPGNTRRLPVAQRGNRESPFVDPND